MYKPPFSYFKKTGEDPRPPLARVSPSTPQAGKAVFDCPVISKGGKGPAKQGPTVKLIDHRKVRQHENSADRRKDLVNAPEITMSDKAVNPEFVKETDEAKLHDFWVFPEECKGVFMDKRTGLAYANVCIIGINGKQWPLFPGNNRAPGFVYEALEDHRELSRRFKQKLAPPKNSGRSVRLSEPRSRVGEKVLSNQEVFNDSLLGKPNFFDRGIDSNATQIIREAKQKYFKEKGISHAQ
jgi:hypothetical protein